MMKEPKLFLPRKGFGRRSRFVSGWVVDDVHVSAEFAGPTPIFQQNRRFYRGVWRYSRIRLSKVHLCRNHLDTLRATLLRRFVNRYPTPISIPRRRQRSRST